MRRHSNVKDHQLFKDKFTYSWSLVGILMGLTLEARYKSNQDFGAPAAPPYPNVHGVNPPGGRPGVEQKLELEGEKKLRIMLIFIQIKTETKSHLLKVIHEAKN